tara:strand:+ start:131 stop:337 length:207 start_codon:yes stop_codon:yes gene_type:complete
MKTDLGLDYLSPTGSIGILILILGALFTAVTFYVFINLDKDSIEERRRKKEKKDKQKELLDKLYPKKD